ncbi:MAG: hypothetical protein V3T86_00470 [Planctomycetota bacterium]
MSDQRGGFLRKLCLYLGALALATIGFAVPGCAHYRVTSMDDDKVITHRETKHVFFWGLMEEPVHLASNATDPKYACASGSLHEVTVTTNLGYALITVLTVGIWSPATVEWSCAVAKSPKGEFPDLPDEEPLEDDPVDGTGEPNDGD